MVRVAKLLIDQFYKSCQPFLNYGNRKKIDEENQPGGLLSGAEGKGLEPIKRLRDPIFSMKDSLRGKDGDMGDEAAAYNFERLFLKW